MSDLHPTGTCFDDALDLITRIIAIHPLSKPWPGLSVVHAICLIPGTSERFAHAWVEIDPSAAGGTGPVSCMFQLLVDGVREDMSMDRDKFYAVMRVQEHTHYSVKEAAIENARTESYGPWEARYYELCADVQRKRAAEARAKPKRKRKSRKLKVVEESHAE